jgi:hypothetical protein
LRGVTVHRCSIETKCLIHVHIRNAAAEPIELDPRLRRRAVHELDFNALLWAMKTLKVLLLLLLLLLL